MHLVSFSRSGRRPVFDSSTERVDIACVVRDDVCGACWGTLTNLDEVWREAADPAASPPPGDAAKLWDIVRVAGPAGIRRLNGLFGAVFVDLASRAATLVSDRYAFAPVYYTQHGDLTLVSDSVDALVRTGLIPRRPDEQSWASFLYLDCVVGDSTFFEGIRRLPPATMMVIGAERSTQTTYWSPMEVAVRPPARWQMVGCLSEAFTTATRRVSARASSPYVFLSGGLDSRLIAAELRKVHPSFPTYSSRKYFPSYDDPDVARHVAKVLGLENTFVEQEVTRVYDFELDAAVAVDFHTWELAWYLNMMRRLGPRLEGTHVDGLVGDVLVQKTFVSSRKMDLLRQRRYRELALLIASERGLGKLKKGLRHLLGKSWFPDGDFTRRWDALIDTVAEELRRYEGHPSQLKLFYMRHRERRAIAAYSTELLARFTRAVYPFLENDFFELVMSIPEELKAELPLEEDMVARAAPELRTIPPASALRGAAAARPAIREHVASLAQYVAEARARGVLRRGLSRFGQLFAEGVVRSDARGLVSGAVDLVFQGSEAHKIRTFPMLTSFYLIKPFVHRDEWERRYLAS